MGKVSLEQVSQSITISSTNVHSNCSIFVNLLIIDAMCSLDTRIIFKTTNYKNSASLAGNSADLFRGLVAKRQSPFYI
jgi:hypothetical protein